MPLIDFPPGVIHETSRRRNTTHWRETNLVRWQGNTIMPIGGWEKVNYSAFASDIKAMHRWVTNDGVQITAYLCVQHCYVDGGDGVLTDITPVDGLAPPPIAGAGGYGDDVYGTEDYGEPRDAANRIAVAPPTYTLDNWGQELRAMTSNDGRLLRWDPLAPGGKLEAVTDAPTGRSFVVTPERHVIIFGADGVEQSFKWSDEEDDTDWIPSTTSKAGGFSIEPASPILASRLSNFGTVFWAANMAYLIQSVGLPYVYGYDKISKCPPPIAPASSADTPDGLMWMAISGFWSFNGVSASPVPCPIWDWIKSRINVTATRQQGAMMHVAPYSEIWVFFVAGDDQFYNNRLVVYNYKDNTWSMGVISRNCGVSSANDPNPVIASRTEVFRHESGYVYTGADMPWAESHTINAVSGANLSTIRQMLPENLVNGSAIRFRFVKRNNPTSGPDIYTSSKQVRSNGYVDVRETARDFRIRVEMVSSVNWSLGPIDMDIGVRGKK